MSLRFFVDHCISNVVVDSLQKAGYEVFRLRDHLPTDSPDPIVLSKAQDLEAILVSLNGDFADIVTYPPAHYKGIVSLQLRNHPEITSRLMTYLLEYLAANPASEHYRGRLFVVEVSRIRVRG